MEENELMTGQDADYLNQAEAYLTRQFLNDLGRYQLIPKMDTDLDEIYECKNVRFFKLKKLVLDQDKNHYEKLLNIYRAAADSKGSVILVVSSDGGSVDISLGVKCRDTNYLSSCKAVMEGTFLGNFPGSKISVAENPLESIAEENTRVVSVVSGIPGKRTAEENNSLSVQGIETVLDAMRGKKYCFITIADYLEQDVLYRIKNEYEEIYTKLSILGEITYNYQQSETKSVARSLSESITDTIGKSLSETVTHSHSIGSSDTVTDGRNMNLSAFVAGTGVQNSKSRSFANTDTAGHSFSKGSSFSQGKSKSAGETATVSGSKSSSVQIRLDNKRIKDIQMKLDQQIARIDDAASLGLWETAIYCMAPDSSTCQVLTSMIKSVFSGDKNTIEGFHSHIWSRKSDSELVQKYIRSYEHPLLKNGDHFFYPVSMINGGELNILAHIPKQSVSGLEVCQKVPFSRNVISLNAADGCTDRLALGNIYHMGQCEDAEISLDYNMLTGHTFISGSTGTGKSNAIIGILKKLEEKKIPYFVMEPVKGEYRHFLQAKVYGANEKRDELLRLNPFQFPQGIHIYEHVDRLLEILKACWPMEAAMPDILKSAILTSYEACGWDLDDSVCISPVYYPNFMDVLCQLETVIAQSAYSEEVKGNYTGSLVSRIRSMTNGINRKIFNSYELPVEKLMTENTILDLSSIGASETKSFIMGIVVMKINEYYLGQDNVQSDRQLSHVTVLEEAHHLLKNPGYAINSPGGNTIQQKAVELLSNSICEMRSYGEGFIIADQSPDAVEASAIKNTNTKIILRLPDYDDRNKVGKSCGLTESQIDEISRFEMGVAAVYQGNWEKAVLCKIYDNKLERKCDKPKIQKEYSDKKLRMYLLYFLLRERMSRRVKFDKDSLIFAIHKICIDAKNRRVLLRIYEKWRQDETDRLLIYYNFGQLAELIIRIMDCEDKLVYFLEYTYDFEELNAVLQQEINHKVYHADDELELALMQCILRRMYVKRLISENYLKEWEEQMR